jgi:hypothetical protein
MAEFNSTETLEEIRQLLGVMKNTNSDSEWHNAAYELCSKVDQLDENLINGGAYPKQWT